MKSLICLLLLAPIGPLSVAQTASMTGRVLDSSRAVVPEAAITATALDSGAVMRTFTDQEGYYSLPALQPGGYSLSCARSGFKTATVRVDLAVQQVGRLDFELEIGAVQESVTVSGAAILLESERATTGQVVGSRQIAELPLLGRNPYALAILVPGVRPSSGVNNLPVDVISTASTSINGARGTQNEYLLDGAPNTAVQQNQPIIYANPDSVQEFKVETNSFSAEYGRAAGGIFNVITKSGTNSPHFSVYEFFRNDKLNANDFFANRAGRARPPFRFNQFGGSAGAPVMLPKIYDGRNRTFFFFNTELVRFAQGITYLGTVPNPDQLSGDFSQTRNAAGQVIQIYDPLNTATGPSGALVRVPFAGNRIPSSRFDPVAVNMARYWPAPNTGGDPVTRVNNFARTDANIVEKNSWSLRLDHSFSDRNRLFGRYSYDRTPFLRAKVYGPDSKADPAAGNQVFLRYNAVVEDTHSFSPSLLGQFRFSYSRLGNNRRPSSDGFDITSLGFPPSLAPQLSEPFSFSPVVITGFGMTGSIANVVVGGTLGSSDLIRWGLNSYGFQPVFTSILSRHTLKFGGDVRVMRSNFQQLGDQGNNFSFTNQWTQGPNPNMASSTAGAALATFLLGVAGGQRTFVPALSHQILYMAGYVQDDFKAAANLTVNLGLRYEFESPRTDRFNQLTNFGFREPVPLTAPGLDLQGALTFVGVGGNSRLQARRDLNNVAPRVGLAWRITPKTILRTGAGIFFGSTTGVGTAFGVSGFEATTTIVTSLDGVTPATFLRDPFPQGIVRPTGSSLGTATLLGQSPSFFNRGNRVPYTSQWNLNIQRELPGTVLFEIGYAASRGVKFPIDVSINQLPDAALGLGSQLQQQVPNPFFGQIAAGPLAQRTVSRAQLMRPYPHFAGLTSSSNTIATSAFHSLQVKAEKRAASGLTLLASYTWSKLMDLSPGPFTGETLGSQAIQNWNNLTAEWSASTLDQTQRLILNGVYEIPLGKNMTRAARRLLGGWQIGGIFSAYGGSPIGVTSAVNNTFSQGGGQRPNWNGQSPALPDPHPDRWLSSAVFSNPPAFTFGTAPRTFNGVRSDALIGLDATLAKNTLLTEKLTLQFRTEFFNLTNTPRFSPPNTVFGNTAFGVVSSQANQPRIVQFALKLIY